VTENRRHHVIHERMQLYEHRSAFGELEAARFQRVIVWQGHQPSLSAIALAIMIKLTETQHVDVVQTI